MVLDGDLANVHLFPAGADPKGISIQLKGKPSNLTAPVFHTVRVRVLSQTTIVPDTQVTLVLARTQP